MAKTSAELAAEITVAWIQAKGNIASASGDGFKDERTPTKEEVAEFYNSTFKAVRNPE